MCCLLIEPLLLYSNLCCSPPGHHTSRREFRIHVLGKASWTGEACQLARMEALRASLTRLLPRAFIIRGSPAQSLPCCMEKDGPARESPTLQQLEALM
jgi:hypothetical protein